MVYRNYTKMENEVIRVEIVILSHNKLSISIQMEDKNRESDVKVFRHNVKVLGHHVKVLGHNVKVIGQNVKVMELYAKVLGHAVTVFVGDHHGVWR